MGFHLILQPMLGRWFSVTGFPARTASSAAEVFTRDRHPVAGTAPVHLTSIGELLGAVENVEIGRTRRFIRLGGFLRLVKQVRKRIPGFNLLDGHPAQGCRRDAR